MLDVFPDDRFVSTYGRDEVSPRPETLTDKPTLALAINSRKMDRTFAFDVPHHLTDRVFRRNRQQHMDMIGHQVPLPRRDFLAVRPVVEIPDQDIASTRHTAPSGGILE